MFPYRIRWSDPSQVQRLGKYVRVGGAFLFLASDPQNQEWRAWFGQSTDGPRIVPLLGSQPIEVPGGMIDPVGLPQLRLDGITSEKVIYRAGRDTVRLLVFALGRAGEQVRLAVY